MNKFATITALTLVAAGLAAPAEAHWRRYAHSHGAGHHTPVRAEIIRDQIEALEDDIRRADNNDTISEREAADLRSRLSGLRSEFHRFNGNGLTVGEMTALENRANYIRDRLRMERYDWDGHAG